MQIAKTLDSGRNRAVRHWVAGATTGALFLIVCLSWGTTWLGIKIAVESVPPLTAAGLRFLIAFPMFVAFALIRRESILFPAGRGWFFAFVTLSYFSLPYYLLNYGEVHVSSGLTALLFSSMPVFILLFSAIFLREKIYLSQVIGIAVGFWSLYMILRSRGLRIDHAEVLGVVAILSAAVMHALCYVITKLHGADISVITYNTLPIGLSGLTLFLAGVWLEQPVFAEVAVRSWSALVYLGLAASVGGFIVYFFLLKRLSPVILSFVFIIFPVFAVLVDAWYEGAAISRDFAFWSALLLVGFAITKLPLEKLMAAKSIKAPEGSKDLLDKAVLQRVYRHSCRIYPDECCGFVYANGAVHEGCNIQNELHQRTPQVYQRTAANGYTFSVADAVALNISLRTPNPAVVVYHSHPDVGAYFSEEDKDKALFAGEPRLAVSHLVIDVRAGRAYGAKLFAWHGTDFVCIREFAA